MSWTDGYIADVSYPAFFYKEMQPVWLSTVAQFGGFAAPIAEDPFALCELGCGAGINLLVAAACHPHAQFVGVDFNGEPLRVARAAAAACGIANIAFVEADFASFAQQNSRMYDFMTCHGTWSWIAPSHRAALADCVSQYLKPGGLFYLHYMCHPGSTDLLPLQHLLNLCAHHMPGPSPRKAQTGMKLLQQMADLGLFADKPAMARHLANMRQRDPADLAHEFLTDHWQPDHSVDVHQHMGDAGLTFIGSADVFNNLDISLSIPGNFQPLVRRTAVPALAETLKDMARGAHQRMDLFQKSPVASCRDTVARTLAGMTFRLLPGAPQPGPVEFSTPIGPIAGPEAIFAPLLERLAAGSARGAELLRLAPFSGDATALLQSLQLLMMQEMAHPAKPSSDGRGDRARALSHWFDRSRIAIAVIDDCATAVRTRTA